MYSIISSFFCRSLTYWLSPSLTHFIHTILCSVRTGDPESMVSEDKVFPEEIPRSKVLQGLIGHHKTIPPKPSHRVSRRFIEPVQWIGNLSDSKEQILYPYSSEEKVPIVLPIYFITCISWIVSRTRTFGKVFVIVLIARTIIRKSGSSKDGGGPSKGTGRRGDSRRKKTSS